MLQALKLLSVMVAIRWDDEPDRIESILTSTLLEGSVVSKIAHAASADPLASTTWEEVILCWSVLAQANNGSVSVHVTLLYETRNRFLQSIQWLLLLSASHCGSNLNQKLSSRLHKQYPHRCAFHITELWFLIQLSWCDFFPYGWKLYLHLFSMFDFTFLSFTPASSQAW